ncbi:hypothetical protein DKG75_13865 [Zavarzinia compransoris]|uniref:Uncharacterized protein n=1 Tax=Zavarzinia compransoris TaxID=1264899 RepID=A0A317DY18_9PROT|nr:hypothetical protein DKG75_13865 [Zavarzinia compransoris]
MSFDADAASKVTVEIFIDGLKIGEVEVERGPGEDDVGFAIVLPPDLVLTAPATVRGRIAASGRELAAPVLLATEDDLRRAVTAAEGVVVLRDGALHVTLTGVAAAVLPLVVEVSDGSGKDVARLAVERPVVEAGPDGLLPPLDLVVPLPVQSLLNIGSVALQVRLAGRREAFAGSPIVISADTGAVLAQRVVAAETGLRLLSEEFADLRRNLARDVARLFYDFAVPRVDAMVEIQRFQIERQLLALWQAVAPDEAPALIPRTKQPDRAQLLLAGGFSGYGWSEPDPELRGERWFRGTGFVLLEVAGRQPLFLEISGTKCGEHVDLARMTVAVNGHIAAGGGYPTATGWAYVAPLPFGVVAANGLAAVTISTVEAQRPGAARAGGDLSVGAIEVGPAKPLPVLGIGDDALVAGWGDVEYDGEHVPFRWMEEQGVILLPATAAGRLILSGPMTVVGDPATQLKARGRSGDLPLVDSSFDGRRWQMVFSLDRRGLRTDGLEVVVLRSVTARASEHDPRMISVAIGGVAVDEA